MAGEEEPFVGLMIAAVVCSCTVVPWLLSLLATMISQPRKRKVLLQRETAAATTGDSLTTLSKPYGDREIREFRVMMASVVMLTLVLMITTMMLMKMCLVKYTNR